MLRQVVRIALQLLEIERGVVVEALASRPVELCIQRIVLELAAPAVVLFQNLFLNGRQHAVEAAQDSHREHHPLVLRWAVRASQQVGDLPNQVGEIVVVSHRSGLLP